MLTSVPTWLAVIVTLVVLALPIVALMMSDKTNRNHHIGDAEIERRKGVKETFLDPDAEPFDLIDYPEERLRLRLIPDPPPTGLSAETQQGTQRNWPPQTPPSGPTPPTAA